MRGNVKVIKFTAFMSILFLALTYFTAVNIETHIFELNTIWVSNGFVLTIFGGAFTSMLVVLICEVQKYITVKASVEDYIFYQTFYLYRSLYLMQQNILDYQKNTEVCVPDNLLDETSRMIQSEIFALQSTDYAPLMKNNLLLMEHQKFCKQTATDFNLVMKGSYAVKIAINKVKIYYLQQDVFNKAVTSIDEPLKTVLTIQLDRVSDSLEKVDEYLKNIDKYCNQRYGWGKQKEQLYSNYVNIFELNNFDEEFQIEI